MKTSELIGPALDWAVAKCEGWELADSDKGTKNLYYLYPDGTFHVRDLWNPSTDWSQGGPIIERECIALKVIATEPLHWKAGTFGQLKGPTALIAAMRCYVASKLGDEVEIPEGLQ